MHVMTGSGFTALSPITKLISKVFATMCWIQAGFEGRFDNHVAKWKLIV